MKMRMAPAMKRITLDMNTIEVHHPDPVVEMRVLAIVHDDQPHQSETGTLIFGVHPKVTPEVLLRTMEPLILAQTSL